MPEWSLCLGLFAGGLVPGYKPSEVLVEAGEAAEQENPAAGTQC